ncbi:hypothetical protein QJQ45_011349 [Haematococcus lacustris]|nr:hypothetical protein QJQ45_011349 [Haematococcus lacustris]
MQRIGESRWRPLELCYWPDQGALPAKGKEYPGLGYKRAEVQRLRDVEQSLMGTVDGLQGDLDDLQAAHQRLQDEHTALQQVASRAAATNHSLRAARRSLQGQVHIYRHKCHPHHSPFTFKQRQQLLVLEQHPVSVEVLRRCAQAGYGRLDGHGRPMGSMPEQPSPAGLAPSPTDIFISTQEAPVGRYTRAGGYPSYRATCATHNSVAKRASAARLACGEIT